MADAYAKQQQLLMAQFNARQSLYNYHFYCFYYHFIIIIFKKTQNLDFENASRKLFVELVVLVLQRLHFRYRVDLPQLRMPYIHCENFLFSVFLFFCFWL